MTLERRLRQLEKSLESRDAMQAAMQAPVYDTDSIIRELGLDPNMIRATARANGQSMAEVIAGELGTTYQEFKKAIEAELAARGKQL